MKKGTDFKNHKAQTPRYLNSSKKSKKSSAKNQEVYEVKAGNGKPETGNKEVRVGPMSREVSGSPFSVLGFTS